MNTPVPSRQLPQITVVIATRGRPAILAETLASLSRQTHPPAATIVVVSAPEDAPAELPEDVEVVTGPAGSTFQRNHALKMIPTEIDFVAFFDDDMELREDYLKKAAEFVHVHPEVAAFSGYMAADGGVTHEEAQRLIQECSPGEGFHVSGKYTTLAGCNMVIRRVLLERETFDENLPLYAFGEDYDISIRLKAHGLVGRFDGCVGAHLQARGGRVQEVQRGYSMVANNWYFLRKGTVHHAWPLAVLRFWGVCVGQLLWQCVSNHLRGDRSIDWRGRAKGCLLAVGDILRGRSEPRRVLEIEPS